MHLHQSALAGEPRLRVVFGNTPVAMGLPVGSTLGDVADWVGDVARKHNGPVRSIDVKCPRRAPPRLG
ncbi:hypothetical protein GJ654_17690 [Rhodoblastus acidophilus]|uniref:Uncharacterized protein n=1 Tax=Rhodoblastus acidophilus TaxID=1074 RepID=A0A6N8DR91_RHOAC|nr:hypothetical protein [Rhodoblastus acidophilus]MCW2276150.1 hypothetical protein [Rhodoblastus acidophilus]MTV32818.1 hypothetical protein [Rhodoblastus acidophilus]